jgi:hypothetical protein
MAHLVDKEFVERANTVLLLGILWTVTDRHIAECEAYIAKQRDLIERAIEQGRSTEVAEETLEALLEASLRALERQRQRLLDRLKERER